MFGLLIGAFVGLSNSPIVGTVVGAAIPIVAVVVNAFSTPRAEKAAASFDDVLVFIAWFSGICLFGAITGMAYRTQSTPTIGDVYSNLVEIGFQPDQAREGALELLKATPADANNLFSAEGLLASGDREQPPNSCGEFVLPAQYPIDAATLESMLRNSNESVMELARAIDRIPGGMEDQEKTIVMRAMFDLACG